MLKNFKKMLLKALMSIIMLLSLVSFIERNLLGQIVCLAATALLLFAINHKGNNEKS